eukprot:330073-Rhodomonas_salina.1
MAITWRSRGDHVASTVFILCMNLSGLERGARGEPRKGEREARRTGRERIMAVRVTCTCANHVR